MIKFLAERKFNYIDIASVTASTTIFNTQHYWYAALVLLSGLALSIYLEYKNKE